jgi:hypothetical protein
MIFSTCKYLKCVVVKMQRFNFIPWNQFTVPQTGVASATNKQRISHRPSPWVLAHMVVRQSGNNEMVEMTSGSMGFASYMEYRWPQCTPVGHESEFIRWSYQVLRQLNGQKFPSYSQSVPYGSNHWTIRHHSYSRSIRHSHVGEFHWRPEKNFKRRFQVFQKNFHSHMPKQEICFNVATLCRKCQC